MGFSFAFPFVFLKGKKEDTTRYGSAKEADPSVIKKMIAKGKISHSKGIVLGKINKAKNAKLYRYNQPLAALILAPPGTGKTTSIAIPNVLGCDDHSLIIHDPKGELCEASIKHREAFSKCYIFNFAYEGSAVFNPFCNTVIPQDERKLRTYVDNVAAAIFSSSNEDYWEMAATDIFRFFALYDLYMKGHSSLPDIYKATKEDRSLRQIIYKRMAKDARGKDLEEEEDHSPKTAPASDDPFAAFDAQKAEEANDLENAALRERLAAYPVLDELANALLQICSSEKQLAGVMGTFTSKMSLFSDPIVEANTSGVNELPFTEMRKELSTVYLIVNDEDRDRLRPVISLMLELMARKLISEQPVKDRYTNPEGLQWVFTLGGLFFKKKLIKGDLRITFILDEFVRLKGINTLKTLPEIGRGYNLASIYIAQDYEQVQAVFGKEAIGIFQSLCAYKVVFKQNNYETALKLATMIGQYTDKRESHSISQNNLLDKGSISTSLEGLNLITAQDIMNLEDDECVIVVEGFAKYPIRAKTSNFFNTEPFMTLFKEKAIKSYKPLIGEQE